MNPLLPSRMLTSIHAHSNTASEMTKPFLPWNMVRMTLPPVHAYADADAGRSPASENHELAGDTV
jgi:hypothetical protein